MKEKRVNGSLYTERRNIKKEKSSSFQASRTIKSSWKLKEIIKDAENGSDNKWKMNIIRSASKKYLECGVH